MLCVFSVALPAFVTRVRNIVRMRRGAPKLWVIEVAATASVGETIALSVKTAAHGKLGTAQCATQPTTSAVQLSGSLDAVGL